MRLSALSFSQTGSDSSAGSSPASMGGASLFTASLGRGGGRCPRSRTGTPGLGLSVKRMPTLPGFSRTVGRYSSVSSRSLSLQISCPSPLSAARSAAEPCRCWAAWAFSARSCAASSSDTSCTEWASALGCVALGAGEDAGRLGASCASAAPGPWRSSSARGGSVSGPTAALVSSSKAAYTSASQLAFSSCSHFSICSRFSRSRRHCSCSPAFSISCFHSAFFSWRLSSRSWAAARARWRRARSSAFVPAARKLCHRPGPFFLRLRETLSVPTRQWVFGCSGSISRTKSASKKCGWQLTLM
mmetsp:Transcript_61975/g.181131  ORF Transcript_61975/g.181131 Transcript_61975/m.181131 type:complete len:301 (+) Transcript_61975:2228-3130(+)